MDESCCVCRVERCCDVSDELDRALRLQMDVVPQELPKVGALDVRHREVEEPALTGDLLLCEKDGAHRALAHRGEHAVAGDRRAGRHGRTHSARGYDAVGAVPSDRAGGGPFRSDYESSARGSACRPDRRRRSAPPIRAVGGRAT
jgi:hypothetical protein